MYKGERENDLEVRLKILSVTLCIHTLSCNSGTVGQGVHLSPADKQNILHHLYLSLLEHNACRGSKTVHDDGRLTRLFVVEVVI